MGGRPESFKRGFAYKRNRATNHGDKYQVEKCGDGAERDEEVNNKKKEGSSSSTFPIHPADKTPRERESYLTSILYIRQHKKREKRS
jgi:hypothetical protein